ncbi:MAG: SUMF1/EgtB/PvdO family nonheme iron enzyme [Opitutae bacterium]|nr:SUMF1/EgtB/PvdO family nonheme iron enzyme [Opitutae bacterium]
MLKWIENHPLQRVVPAAGLILALSAVGGGVYWFTVRWDRKYNRPPSSVQTVDPAAPAQAANQQSATPDEIRARITALEQAAEEELKANKVESAGTKLREALQLQHNLNASPIEARYKSVVRESRLSQRVESLVAEPLRQSMTQELLKARAAVVAQKWDEARTGFAAALEIQTRINREFSGSAFVDRMALMRIEEEMNSAIAAGLAAAVADKENAGSVAEKASDWPAATAAYARAVELQRALITQAPRSRQAAPMRLTELEAKRQTAASAESVLQAQRLDGEAALLLRRRQGVAASAKIAAATAALQQASTDFPESRRLDPELKLKLAYLELHRSDLAEVQDSVYSQLRSVPGQPRLLMCKSEVPQSLYRQIMSTQPSRHVGPEFPVDSVSWRDTQEFCRRLGWLLGTPVRLPTLEEWQAALTAKETAAWHTGTADRASHECARSAANANGFHDLLGNLAEWLQPASTAHAETAPVAGGSFLDAVTSAASATVVALPRQESRAHVGFRFVVERPAELTP